MIEYEKNIWSPPRPTLKNNMNIENRNRIKTSQEHGKEVKKDNMDFKNINGSLNLLRQNHKSTKRRTKAWTCQHNTRKGSKPWGKTMKKLKNM
jgi:hypothetical protein